VRKIIPADMDSLCELSGPTDTLSSPLLGHANNAKASIQLQRPEVRNALVL
jgi:hypothetical protein